MRNGAEIAMFNIFGYLRRDGPKQEEKNVSGEEDIVKLA